MSCECFQIGGPFIGVDPDCEIHCKGGYEDRIAELEASIESKSDIISRLYDQIESMEKHRCDHCGANIIDNCPRCGAPQCCPQCCRIAELEAELTTKTAENISLMDELEQRDVLIAILEGNG